MDLCQNKRGVLIDMKYMDDVRVDLHYALPLGEIVYDFFDASRAGAAATPATTTSSRSTARATWSSWTSCSTETPWMLCP